LLFSAYTNSLKLAVENKITTIAFPNISTGIYGFPKNKAAKIAVDAVKKFLTTNQDIKKVIFVCFDKENYDIYNSIM
jgi:O-acetyl-ADP-ribose deacetylase (regulator of RNase III)